MKRSGIKTLHRLSQPTKEEQKQTKTAVSPGLSPEDWLARLKSVWPLTSRRVLTSSEGKTGDELLAYLASEFDKFDAWIGTCPIPLDPTFVMEARTILGSLKKFRFSKQSPSLLSTAAMDRFELNNSNASRGVIPTRFKWYMRAFIADALKSYSNMSADPHFGPGAVAEKLSILRRWEMVGLEGRGRNCDYDFRDPLQILDAPFDSHPLWRDGVYRPHPCRLCAVPKDWNKRRLITVEPWSLSYLQHCCRESLLLALKRAKTKDLRCLASPSFSDPQERHRRLAQRGSVDGSLATLDMSDASDMVSYNQVADVFPANVMADLDRARSTWYVRDKASEPRPLHMFGGMGNATTFVVETIMFHAACYAIARYYRIKHPFISCYGDDMIVSSDLAKIIVDLKLFEEFGWRLNVNKSFFTIRSRFRESCGGQYYAGKDVTLLRYRGYTRSGEDLAALTDLVRRCCTNPRWVEVVAEPWYELSGFIPNSQRYSAPGALITSVPWWPDTLSDCSGRRHKDYQARQLLLPCLVVPSTVVRTTGQGPVYGALSGQLSEMTGTRRIHNRKVYGVVVALPKRARVERRWCFTTDDTWSF